MSRWILFFFNRFRRADDYRLSRNNLVKKQNKVSKSCSLPGRLVFFFHRKNFLFFLDLLGATTVRCVAWHTRLIGLADSRVDVMYCWRAVCRCQQAGSGRSDWHLYISRVCICYCIINGTGGKPDKSFVFRIAKTAIRPFRTGPPSYERSPEWIGSVCAWSQWKTARWFKGLLPVAQK